MSRSDEDRRLRSNSDAALTAVKKCLVRPSGSGLLLPETRATRDVGSLNVSSIDLHAIARRARLGKAIKAPSLVDTLPLSSSNARDITVSATRSGGVALSTAGYQDGPTDDAQPPRYGTAPQPASVSSRSALPTDSDDPSGTRKGRADESRAEDEDNDAGNIEAPLRVRPDPTPDPHSVALNAIKRATHPSKARRIY